MVTKQDIEAYHKVLLMLNEDIDSTEYQTWMNAIQVSPIEAGQKFLNALQSSQQKSPTVKRLRLIEQLEGILQNERQFFQRGARSQEEALIFLVSNALMSGGGLKVLEDVEIKGSLTNIQKIANTINS